MPKKAAILEPRAAKSWTVSLYPLRFEPLFKSLIWGGARLEPLFGRPPSGEAIGEVWLLSDVDGNESKVSNGPLAGRTIRDLCRDHRAELLGDTPLSAGRFPLLLKFIDAKKELSVQVHPTDAQAERSRPGQLGKTEAWVVLERDEATSLLYVGLREGVTRASLEGGIVAGTAADALHRFVPEAGDAILLDAGTVHAIGKDLLLFEIQQTSDITYRLYDWGRVDDQGNPRQLHVQEGLACTDFTRGPVRPIRRASGGAERLVECNYFSLDRVVIQGERKVGRKGACSVHVCIDGEGTLDGEPLRPGDTVLLPASGGEAIVRSAASVTLLVGAPP